MPLFKVNICVFSDIENGRFYHIETIKENISSGCDGIRKKKSAGIISKSI